MEKNIIIVRGTPGSGKSTFAKLLGRAICTADDYFTKKGVYNFDVTRLHLAHKWCRTKCERFMKAGVTPIIVANTSISTSDVNVYIRLAKEYDYKYFSVIVENRHGRKNIHGCPEETIERFKKNFNIEL